MKHVVIIGGGVAGLSCASFLSYYRKFSITLVDKNPFYINQVRLHQSFQKNFEDFLFPYKKIARTYGFHFLQDTISLTPEWVDSVSKEKFIRINQKEIPFDHLVLATGAREISLEPSKVPDSKILTLGDFQSETGKEKLKTILSRSKGKLKVHFVGGGPTSIQFLFELKDHLKELKIDAKLNLIDMETEILGTMPVAMRNYVVQKFKDVSIKYLPRTKFISETETGLLIQNLVSGEEKLIDSNLIFLFPGVRANPYTIESNEEGRVIHNGTLYTNIYSAGDCSLYRGDGLNSLTAQAAVRKGRSVGNNIKVSLYRGNSKPYTYKPLGYFVNLGCNDAVGWAFSENTLLTGYPANALKEGIDLQMEGMFRGINTYVDYS